MRRLTAKELKDVLDGFVPSVRVRKPVKVYEVTCAACVLDDHFHARDIKGLEQCLEVNGWAKSSAGYVCNNCLNGNSNDNE